MARMIVTSFNGEVSQFGITRVTRDKVYGKKRRIIVGSDGRQCSPGMLTLDGATVLGQGSTASVYVDEDFNSMDRKDLTPVSAETGEELEPIESTLNVEQTLTGPIDPEHFLDHIATALYQLDPTELGEKTLAGLEAGGVFETRFNYSKGYKESPLFLLKNDNGIFAIVGQPTAFEPCLPDAPPPEEAEEDDLFDEDDMDFGMF